MDKRNVIIVTDGDRAADQAVEIATANVGGRCISLSAGNPTWLSGEDLVKLIKDAPHDPVVIMVDDRGDGGYGRGESALRYIANHPEIYILGVLAVASNTTGVVGVPVDCSVNREGGIISSAVDKLGFAKDESQSRLEGDTVDVLNLISPPIVVGIGDIGKMDGIDDFKSGAPLTTMALREIMERSGFNGSSCGGKQNQTE
ncbi:MAG: stage V sporulation protein AE [Firmicutes bacterium]|nr:stage V sporulation protein AE [Bacillota bacterium]